MLSRVRRDDRGVTLAETVVAMSLMTVVGAMALTFFVWTGRTTSGSVAASFGTNEARIAVTTVAGTIRLADSPTSFVGSSTGRIANPLSASTITFYANDNANRPTGVVRGLPTKVTFTVSGGTLVELRYAPLAGAVASSSSWDANYPSTPTLRRTLLTGISSATFGYAVGDANGNVTPVTDLSKATTAAAVAAVVSVSFSLTLAAAPGRPTQSFTATASITGSAS